MARGNQGKFQYTIVSSNVSPRSLSTLRKIQQKRRKSVRQGTTCAFYDNSSPVYDWLLPGWLAEERVVESGRLYRYYYDSTGKFYETKQEVLYAYDCIGVIDLNA